MHKHNLVIKTAIVLATTLVAGCSGGGAGDGIPGTSGDFIVLRTTPNNNGQLYLNEEIALDFSNNVDLGSADFSAMTFAVFDLNGKQLSEPVEGRFGLSTATGDQSVRDPNTGEITEGRRLVFKPKFPTTDTYDNGGFRPGREYIVQLIKGDHRRNVGLLDYSGKGLESAVSFKFTTADGTTPSQLFRDTKVGGPRKTSFSVTPSNPLTQEVELSQLGQVATEIRLSFDQPLNPHSANVPFGIDLDPRTRSVNSRGRIFLEYDDAEGDDTWIPAAVEVEANQLEGSVLVLRPFGILPNNASIRVIVEATLEDMSGESNVNDASYNRVFGEFQTQSSYDVGFDALVENFVNLDVVDLTAGFVEPLAEIVPGAIRANFDFEGSRTNLKYEPTTQEVVLDTDFTQILPSNGQPINVSNGIFTFQEVKIPAGVTVRGTGSNPMVWLVTGDFEVSGRLLVSGGAGQRVDTLNSANFPSGGGIGNCGGGNGGQASQFTNSRTETAEKGFGPSQVPNVGGGGGRLSCTSSCLGGSGGGGGSFVTQGDPYYKAAATAQWVQPTGVGAFGCANRNSQVLPGGEAGSAVFTDPRPDNNFWGSAVNVNLGMRISGEMVTPHGGQGGGGGGDYSLSCAVPDRRNFANDEKGGGGGGGGGVLIIKALGSIIVTKTGKIIADGGNGGGGAWAGSCNRAGGGGGGAGGMVVLMAGKRIQLYKHGGPYAAPNNNYDFSISADGGVGLLDVYGSATGWIRGKYDPFPHLSNTASNMNGRPAGGFGGLGLIQLMAPPGPNPGEDDQTNTILDDSIDIIDPITLAKIEGADKMRFLAWRGTMDPNGVPRDDEGVEVIIGKEEGDIRPTPILMPAPYGTRSRIRSTWIDLGAANRRMTVLGGDGVPRGVGQTGSFTPGDSFGPQPEFSAVNFGDMLNDPVAGYIKTKDGAISGVDVDYPEVAGAVDIPVASLSNVNYVVGGSAANYYKGNKQFMRVTLSSPSTVLGTLPERYSHYFAFVTENGSRLTGDFRLLGHDDRTIYLSSESGTLPDMVGSPSRQIKITLTSKLFSVFTNGIEGFPQSFIGRNAQPGQGVQVPRANIRIGFAFHQDPSDSNASRFPALNAGRQTFFADWGNTTKLNELYEGGYRYVMYDVLFNTQYQESSTFPNTNSLGPDTPRPELRRLVLPYRY